MFERIKNIIVAPKNEWGVIESENTSHSKLFVKYVLPLSLIPAVSSFIGYGFFKQLLFGRFASFSLFTSLSWGIGHAVVQWVSLVLAIYLAAMIINLLADSFGAKKDFDKAFSLVAFAYTPMFIGGVFYIFPFLSFLAMIMGIYGLYLLYVGMQPMMKAPDDKNTIYFVVSLVVMLVVTGVIMAIMTSIMTAILFSGLFYHVF